MYTFFAIKTVLLSCVALFEIGSIVCGAAPNSAGFIAGRAIAGVGAAGIFSGCVSCMSLPFNLILKLTESLDRLYSLRSPVREASAISRVFWCLVWNFFHRRPINRWWFHFERIVEMVFLY